MSIEFWLSYNNNAERLRLPVNPESISVSSPFSNTDVKIAQLGEYSIIGERDLQEYSFSTFFPADYNPSYCGYSDFPSPQECVDIIESWRDERKPIRLVVTGTKINKAVTIREFSYDVEKAGHLGDIYFSLALKEYRFLSVKKVEEVSSKASISSSSKERTPVINSDASKKTSGSYTIKSGDSLSKISKEVYGSANQWRKIYDANKKVIGANPNQIKPNVKLVIPK